MRTVVGYHSSATALLIPRPILHVGTIAQAAMRGGKHLHRVEFALDGRMPRMRDQGDWSRRSVTRHTRAGGAVVYLNRHEGIPLEEFEAARAITDIDAISDAMFKRLIPSAEDSWIILNPDIIQSIEEVEDPKIG